MHLPRRMPGRVAALRAALPPLLPRLLLLARGAVEVWAQRRQLQALHSQHQVPEAVQVDLVGGAWRGGAEGQASMRHA